MFPLLRHFSIASLIVVVLTTMLIGVLHHFAERDQLLDLGQGNHVALTQSFANTLLPAYRDVVAGTRGLDADATRAHPLVKAMHPRVVAAMDHTQVIKVKLYDLEGRTVFSTDSSQIGKLYADNPGFLAAARGLPKSELTHRERFSAFDREIVDRDVLSSYVALRSKPDAPIEGVLEVYSDVTNWVSHIDRQARLVTLATVVAFCLLYGALFVVVRRADRLIRFQYEQLRRSESELTVAAAVFESQEPMVVMDEQRRIIRANNAFLAMTGLAADALSGEPLAIIGSARNEGVLFQALWAEVGSSGFWRGSLWGRKTCGREFPAWLTVTAVRDGDGAITHYVGTLTDVTERVEAEEKIRHLAYHDTLTGLPNRTLLRDRLTHAMAICARSSRFGALLFIDLDRFKAVNDTLGHEYGDLLLREVALRLQAATRECDTVSRWGGDEFIVMLENLDPGPEVARRQLREVAGKILEAFNPPFQLGEHRRESTPSIGAALFRGTDESIDVLLKKADDAMYRAKGRGRNCIAVDGED